MSWCGAVKDITITRLEAEVKTLTERLSDAEQLTNTHYDGKARYRDKWAQEKNARLDAEAALAQRSPRDTLMAAVVEAARKHTDRMRDYLEEFELRPLVKALAALSAHEAGK